MGIRRSSPLRVAAVVALLVVVGHISAEDKCRSGCGGMQGSHTFKYAEGSTYTYNLEGNVDFELSSAEGQLSTTKIKAVVLLTQQAQCNQVLRVQDLQIYGPDAKKFVSPVGVALPIKLNFHDGHIEDVVCADPSDTQNSMNVKRAIASLFQFATKSGFETDVFGTCPTESSSRKEGDTVILQKSRRLNRCSHRESVQHDFISTAFNIHSELKSSPVLNSLYSAEQRVKNGIMQQVTVTETYNFLPFQIGKSGARASVHTKLTLSGTTKDSPKAKVSDPRSIIFENPHPVLGPRVNVQVVLEAVKDAAKTIGETVSDKTANKFSNLIRAIAVAKKDDLLTVFNKVKSGAGFKDSKIAKKVFLDALFRAGSGDAVEVAIELLKSKQLQPLEEKLVYLGLAFVKHATPASLISASSLLDQPNLPREGYLGIGTLAGRYCASHNCDNVDQLNKVIQKLVSKIDAKVTNRKQENNVISILKAIANIKHLNDAAVGKITSIAQDKTAPTRMRSQALQTYLADSCKDKIRDSAISILKDNQQDSEIRIRAYLVLVQCPNGKVANALKKILDDEESVQVGGFIVSHLRNLRASANPDKELAKQQLALVNTNRKFPWDPRRFSLNNEFSYTINTLGMANAAESNMIYSPNSYLPRSASLNMTSQVFGHTFNFLEVGLRQENLDKLVEHYLGPLGVLRSKKPEEVIATGRDSADKIVKHIRERFTKSRSKRDLKKEVDTISKQVDFKPNEFNDDLDLDLCVKLFGSEILFLSIDAESNKLTPNAIIDHIFDTLDKGIEHVKKFDHTIQSNMKFLDVDVSYPTSMGFPLRLSLEGTSSVQIKAAGSIDLKAILSSNKDQLFKLSLIPSANIELVARFTMDAMHVDAGLQFSPTLHTATGSAIEIEFFNSGTGVDVKFSLPVEKQQLVSVSYDIIFNNRELGVPEINTPIKFSQNKDFSICLDQLSPIIGLTMCVELNSPNAIPTNGKIVPWALAGNSKLAVSIEKEENFEVSEYHLRNVLHTDPSKHGVEFILETKGKNQVSLKIDAFVTPEKFFKATLNSPIKKATLEGRITDSSQEKSASLEFEHDGSKYSGKVGVAISGGGSRSVYKPLIEYRTSQNENAQTPPYTVEGQIIVEENGSEVKYTFDNVKLIIPEQDPVTINGNVGRSSETYSADVSLGHGSQTGSFKGRLMTKPDHLKLNAEMQNNVNPAVNFNAKYELKRQPNELENSLQLIHGADLTSKTNRLILHNEFIKKVKSAGDWEVGTKNELSYPLAGIDGKFELHASPKSIDYDLEGKYNNMKVGSELKAKINEKQKGDYNFEFELDGFDNKMTLKAKRGITGDKSKIDNSLEVNGKKIEVSGLITHHIKPQDLDIGADLTIKVPTRNDPIKWSGGLKHNTNELDTYLKISCGTATIIDAFLKANKNRDINGSVKITIEQLITANGQITSAKGVGSGTILIELVKSGRKIKADTKFDVTSPKLNVHIALRPNFEKDSVVIQINTDNEVMADSIASKNLIECNDKKLEANFNGKKTGHLLDGVIAGDYELTLPNMMYFAGKLNRELHVIAGITNGKVSINLEQRDNKNAAGRKLVLNGLVKDSNFKDRVFDVAYDLDLQSASGQTLKGEIIAKRQKEGDKRIVLSRGKLTSSRLKHPLEFEHRATCEGRDGSYNLKSSFGSENVGELSGKYNGAEGKPISGEFEAQIKTENPKVKLIKVFASGETHVPTADRLAKMSGKAGIFIDDDGSTPDATVDIHGEGDVSLQPHSGVIQGTFNFQKQDPISAKLDYSHKEQDGNTQCHGKMELMYSKNKVVKADATLNRKSLEHDLDLKIETPDKIKSLRIQSHVKRTDDNQHRTGQFIITADGKVYTIDSEIAVSETTPIFKISMKHPDNKIDLLHVKANRINPNHVSAEVKTALAAKDFTLDGSIDAELEKLDDFHLKMTANSPKLGIKDIVLDAKSEAGKKVSLDIKSEGNNVVSGTTTYKAREEAGKYIVEGSGNLKVKDKDQAANFKYIRQILTMDKNNEQGFEISVDGSLGSRAIDAELKITNKQFHILNSYCEEKKQCAHVEIDSKTNSADITHFSHELEINVDLRKLGIAHEFGLKSATNREQFTLDHTVDVHIQSEDNKYQHSVYVHPHKAGISITTPKRIVSLEAESNIEPGKQIKGEISLYMNKKSSPKVKTSLSGEIKHAGDYKIGTCEGDIKFETPGINRPLSITFKRNFDIPAKKDEFSAIVDTFATPAQKIELAGKLNAVASSEEFGYAIDFSAKSTGMNMDIAYSEGVLYKHSMHHFKAHAELKSSQAGSKHHCALLLETTPSQATTFVRIMNNDLFSSKAKMQLTKESQVIDAETTLIGTRPLVSHLELKNWNNMKLVLNHKATPNHKLVINAAFIPGQIADARITAEKDGKNDLMFASVKLDEKNFLKSDYGLNMEAVKKFVLEPMRTDIENVAKEGRAVADRLNKDVADRIKKASEIYKSNVPNFKPAVEYFTNEASKIKEEIAADKTVQEIVELMRNIFGTVSQVFNGILVRLVEITDKLTAILKANITKFQEIIDKDVIPKAKEAMDKLANSVGHMFQSLSNIVFTVIAKISEFLEAHQAELQELATTLSTIGQDIGRLIIINYEKARELIVQNFNRIYEELKALPIYEELKTRYDAVIANMGGLSEPLIATLQEAGTTINDLLPNDDLKQIAKDIMEYVLKKLRMEKVNDIQAIEIIVNDIVSFIQKLINQINIGELKFDERNLFTTNFFYDLPKLAAARFSPWTYLTNGDLPSISNLIYGVSFNPHQWVPPLRMYALVVQGQQVFTFDGKHLMFPGKCNYLLTHDALNGNFSVIGNFANGLITAISLVDANGDSITAKKDGHLLLNNAATEYPAVKGNLVAYRKLNSIALKSEAGVSVECSPDLTGCAVEVNGFYHGRLRGMLGNGNAEPFDDFTLPNGKITASEADFGNAYKMSTACPPVKTIDHSSIQHAAECNKYFGSDSPLRFGFPFVSAESYRSACDHAVAAGLKDAVKMTVMAYAGACYTRGIPIRYPEEFIQCTNSEKPLNIGDTFIVKLPAKAADVVIIVDRSKINEPIYKDMIQPLVTQLTQEFEANGIPDVEFHLMGYGGDYKGHPIHMTTNGKLTWKGKAPTNVKFADDSNTSPSTGVSKLDSLLDQLRMIKEDVDLVVGQDIQSRAFVDAMNYPFRAHALKTLVVLTSGPCKQGNLLALQKLRSLLFRTEHVTVNLITPMPGFKVRDAKTTKNVIGFNEHNVFTYTDAKKKPEGGAELHKDLEYNDYCVDWTAKHRGNVFVVDNFLQAKGAGPKKQFVQVAAHNIVDQLISVEQGLDCKCRLRGYEASNECTVVLSRPSNKTAKKGSKKK